MAEFTIKPLEMRVATKGRGMPYFSPKVTGSLCYG